MTRTLFPVFAALVVAVGLPPAFAADPVPGVLKYVPPDAALFVHLDVAAIHDSKLGESLKKSKAAETILGLSDANKLLGAKLGDVNSITFSFPNLQDQSAVAKSLSVVTFRQKYDREKLVAALKEQAKKVKGEVEVKDNVVKVTMPSPFGPDNKLTTTHDLTDDTRIVSAHGLGDEYLKPSDATGVHTLALKANATAHVIVGFNFNALPDELKKEDLPAEFRPFRPILMADGLTAVGTVGKDKLAVSIAVKAKNKADAGEVEKSLDALRQLADTTITTAKKNLKTDVAKPKEIGELFDILQAAMKEAKFAVNDSTTTASLSVPLDAPYGPFFDLLTGGGASERTVSTNNLKQLGLAMHNYESTHQHLPTPATLGKKGKKLLSWRVEVLPYIEQDDLYKKFNLDEAWDSEHNLKVFKDNPMPKVFAIPGTTNEADKKTHYQVFVGNGAMFEPTGPTKLTEISDGTSNTFMVATAAKAVEWTKPDDIEFEPKAEVAKLLLFKDGVSVVCFGDGSVRAISDKVAEKSLRAYVTRNGGEVVSDD
jgi:hypothetical protein